MLGNLNYPHVMLLIVSWTLFYVIGKIYFDYVLGNPPIPISSE